MVLYSESKQCAEVRDGLATMYTILMYFCILLCIHSCLARVRCKDRVPILKRESMNRPIGAATVSTLKARSMLLPRAFDVSFFSFETASQLSLETFLCRKQTVFPSSAEKEILRKHARQAFKGHRMR